MYFFRNIFKVYKGLMKKSYSTLSGAIAFFLIINGGSIIYLMITISRLLKIDLMINNDLILQVINTIADNTNSSSSVIFFLISIYSASTLFFHLIKIGEMIYEEVNNRFNLLKRLIAIIFLGTFLFIIEIFFIVLLLTQNLFNNIGWQIIRYSSFIVLVFLIALCIIFYITPHEVLFKEIKKGAILTTTLWFLITIFFTIFLKIVKNYKAIYGPLTIYIIFMTWLYLLAQGLILGVVYNYYHKTKIDNLLYLEPCKLEMAHQKETYEKKHNISDISDSHSND